YLLRRRAGLDDLRAVQHGAGKLLGKRQAEEGAAESDHERPNHVLLAHRTSDIDAECGEDEIHQHMEGNREGDEDQHIGDQQQSNTFQPLHWAPPSSSMADPQRMETTCASERQGHIIQLRGRKIIQVPSRSCQCGADNLISVFVKVEVSWHAVLRFRASRGTPSTAVRSGTLLVFPSPWSSTTVRWSVPAFLSGCRVGPRRSGNV